MLTVCISRLFNLEKSVLVTKKKSSDTPKPTKGTPTTVTRIKASDAKPKKAEKAIVSEKVQPKKETPTGNSFGRLATPFAAVGGYFKGAWYELKQVRWPNRRATWSLTAAVIGFTAVFTIIILLLDALFKYLFQLILG